MKLFGLLFFGLIAQAQVERKPIELLFGPEEEFRSPGQMAHAKKGAFRLFFATPMKEWSKSLSDLEHYPSTQKDIRTLVQSLHEKCKSWPNVECTWVESRDKFFIDETYPELHFRSGEITGKFQFTIDPGVLELKSSPITLKDLDGVQGQIYDRILNELDQQNWKLARLGGEGHVHIDLKSAFGVPPGPDAQKIDLKRYYNFIASWLNHNELTWGIWNYDPKTIGASPHFSERINEADQILFYMERLEKAAQGRYPTPNYEHFMEQFVRLAPFSKGEAMSLNRHLGTLELRILPPKYSLDQMKRYYQFLERWVNWADQQPKLVEFYGGYAPRDWREAMSRYAHLSDAIGMPWEDAKALVPPTLRWIPPRRGLPLSELYSSKKWIPSNALRSTAWICNQLLRPNRIQSASPQTTY